MIFGTVLFSAREAGMSERAGAEEWSGISLAACTRPRGAATAARCRRRAAVHTVNVPRRCVARRRRCGRSPRRSDGVTRPSRRVTSLPLAAEAASLGLYTLTRPRNNQRNWATARAFPSCFSFQLHHFSPSRCSPAVSIELPLFRDCCSRCRFQPYDCVIIRFVESIQSPPSDFVNGHVSTTWFMVCRWPQSQEGDWVSK